MTHDDKHRLVDFLTGTDMPLAPAMFKLGIVEGLSIAKAELADTVAACRVCHKWTDVDVMEADLCPRCDERLNPDNQQKP